MKMSCQGMKAQGHPLVLRMHSSEHRFQNRWCDKIEKWFLLHLFQMWLKNVCNKRNARLDLSQLATICLTSFDELSVTDDSWLSWPGRKLTVSPCTSWQRGPMPKHPPSNPSQNSPVTCLFVYILRTEYSSCSAKHPQKCTKLVWCLPSSCTSSELQQMVPIWLLTFHALTECNFVFLMYLFPQSNSGFFSSMSWAETQPVQDEQQSLRIALLISVIQKQNECTHGSGNGRFPKDISLHCISPLA